MNKLKINKSSINELVQLANIESTIKIIDKEVEENDLDFKTWFFAIDYEKAKNILWEYIVKDTYVEKWNKKVATIDSLDKEHWAYGQCVSLVKTLTESTMISTKKWKKWEAVTEDNLPTPWDIIATFTNWEYDFCHTAVCLTATKEWILVLDQNWYNEEWDYWSWTSQNKGIAWFHFINFAWSRVNNAKSYSTVEI